MQEFAANTDVTLTIEYDYNGKVLTLTAFDYEVTDAEGTVLVPQTTDPNFVATSGQSTITIPAAQNQTTLKRDVRMFKALMTTTEGTYTKFIVYTIVGNELQLTPLVDSFMTFQESVLMRFKISDEQSYYDELEDKYKVVALENAYERLSKLQYKDGATIVTDITALTLPEFNALSENFRTALKKAQIVEANVLVENSPVKDKIRSGIISETIGESSMFFRQSGIPDGRYPGLSDEAYEHLAKYLYKETTSSQIWTLARA